ncbi:hypothetical protein K437DRAFT_265577 [Tilletiaria anomala UBC 951]|uniref:Uncharacterized protein n=1 Tax=Tilletiaria anomala (strain ATCC 24038 / CBS 436.72 / UBC 951) TaxID=1037660 RepID=A0A066WS47_TILAU|nr:uncharacterized protein K437DRAFT_265577 [Tilletiaria anomala UBC 951]KDN53510.1 hypothetical protein K437DRAFT_265577 [Tilletiaria anomala UBC 951]
MPDLWPSCLLQVKNGQLLLLSPLSGNYGAGTAQFRQFVRMLQAKGIDLSHVQLSKNLTILGALEKNRRLKKRIKVGGKEKTERRGKHVAKEQGRGHIEDGRKTPLHLRLI